MRWWIAWAGVLAAGVAVGSSPAQGGRHYEVDDLLRLESVGRVMFAPGGGRLYAEYFPRFDAQAAFNREWVPGQLRSRLLEVDVATGAAAPAFHQRADTGYTLAGLSPDGSRLAYVETTQDAVRLAVRNGRGPARVFAQAPVGYGTTSFQWVGSGSLVFTATTDKVPGAAAMHSEDRDALYRLWQSRNAGREATAMVLGSGRFAGQLEDRSHVVLWNVAGDGVVRLGENNASYVTPSPDRRWVAYALPERADLGGVTRLEHGINSGGREWRLQLKAVDQGDALPLAVCEGCDGSAGSLSWSPDGSRFLFVGRPGGSDWKDAVLYLYDVATRRLERVEGDWMPHPGRMGAELAFRTAWVGGQPAILARPRSDAHIDSDSRADWYVRTDDGWRAVTLDFPGERTPQLVAVTGERLALVHDGDLWTVDAAGDRRNLTAGVDAPLAAWQRTWLARNANNLQPATRVMVQQDRARDDDGLRLWFVDLDSGASRSLELPARDTDVVAVSLEAGRVAVIERAGGESVLSLLDVDGGRREVLRLNRHLAEVAHATPVRIDHSGPDGSPRHSWLLLPPDYRPGTRLATIVNVYPGSAGTEVWLRWRPDTLNALNDHVLAGRGYAVLYPSLPVDYTRVPRDPVEGLVEDVFAAVDAAVAAGYVDGDRLAVQGQSYGGYTTALLVGQTDRFRSAVAQAGFYNLLSMYGTFDERSRINEQDNGLSLFAVSLLETSQGGMGAPPWDDPERYLRNSPLMHVKHINAPIMLLHGDRDYVPTQQAEELLTALTRLGKDVVFVRYFGEDHVYQSPANIRDMWRRIFDWYAQTLGAARTGGRGLR